MLFISLLTFTAFSVIPGDAAVSKLGVDASPEAIARVRAEYELDQPVLTRYVHWLGKALHGDFGQSYKYDTMTVTQLLQSRLPVTILLAVMSFIIIIVVSLPLGMLSARYAGKWLDVVINQVTQITMAIPSFFLGIILTVIFGLVLKVFQPGGLCQYAGGPERMHRVPDPSGCCGSASKDCDGCEVSSKFRIKRNEERLCQNGLAAKAIPSIRFYMAMFFVMR